MPYESSSKKWKELCQITYNLSPNYSLTKSSSLPLSKTQSKPSIRINTKYRTFKLKLGATKKDKPRILKGISDLLTSLKNCYLKFHWMRLLFMRKSILKTKRSKCCMNSYSDRKKKKRASKRLWIDCITKITITNASKRSFKPAFRNWKGSTRKSLSNMSEPWEKLWQRKMKLSPGYIGCWKDVRA